MDPKDAELAKAIILRHCAIKSSEPGGGKRKIDASRLTLHSITKRDGDWLAADVTSPGLNYMPVRGNVYFNKTTNEYACGTNNWRRGMASSSPNAFATHHVTPYVTANFTADYSSLKKIDEKKVTLNSTKAVPIYTEPSHKAPVIMNIGPDHSLYAFEETAFWLHVKDKNSGQSGWITKGKVH
ncbi:MAG: SH3 domain-containing protein [Magnetovibrio sp.]|nr:SH3 domain-containing protein [Magnetovibrio sp.]